MSAYSNSILFAIWVMLWMIFFLHFFWNVSRLVDIFFAGVHLHLDYQVDDGLVPIPCINIYQRKDNIFPTLVSIILLYIMHVRVFCKCKILCSNMYEVENDISASISYYVEFCE